MFGCLLSHQAPKVETSRRISVSSICDSKGGDCSWSISDVQNLLKQVLGTSTSFSVGFILSRHTLVNSGERYIVRLWLIFGGCVVGIDLPVIWLSICLKHLVRGMRILGVGSGVALRKVGRRLRDIVVKWAGTLRSS